MKIPYLTAALLLTGLSTLCAQSAARRGAPLPPADSTTTMRTPARPKAFEARQLIASYALELAYNKTTSLIFSAAIRSVDLGSRDILADKAGEAENVLRLKSSRIGFNETNFSVMTADGRFYSFVATYNEAPAALAIVVPAQAVPSFAATVTSPLPAHPAEMEGSARIEFEKLGTPQQTVEEAARRVLAAPAHRLGSARRQRMRGAVRGLYVAGDLMYLRLRLQNDSHVPYDVNSVRFYATDRQRGREAALQELEIPFLTVQPVALERVRGREVSERVFVFRKFTLSPRQRLRVLVGEKNGGRSLDWSLASHRVIGARSLPAAPSGKPRFWQKAFR